MLTTADWLLGSNSQSAAGLSTLSDRMERWEHLLFSTLSEWRHDVQKQNIVPDTLQTSSVTLVPSIQKGCCNCGILFRAWFNTDWIWLPCLRMVRFFFYLIYFYIWMSQAASSIVFFVLSVFRACPLPLLFHRCEESPPPTRSTYEPASLEHVRHDSELLLQPWEIPPSMTSVPTLSINFTRKKVKKGGGGSSCLPKVKWMDFKELWAVRKLRNDQHRSVPELHHQTRSKSAHHTPKDQQFI